MIHPLARLALLLALPLAAAPARAVVLGFDGFVPATQPTSFEEQGFVVSVESSFLTGDTGPAALDPPTLSPFQVGTPVRLERYSGRPFDFLSFSAREVNDGVGAQAIQVTGTLAAGGTVVANLETDGACCATGYDSFVLPETFRDLTAVTFVAGIVQLDDLAVDVPAVGFDGFAGGAASFEEDGMRLSSTAAIFVSEFFVPQPPSIFASFGSQSFTLAPADGGVFDLLAFEAREFNETSGADTVVMEGTRFDGVPVYALSTVDGACCAGARFGFETFETPDAFRQLRSVTWSQTELTYDTFEAVPVAPANDAAEDAVALPASGAAGGTLVRATNDAAVSVGDSAASPDAWFRLDPAETTVFALDLCGTHDAPGEDAGVDAVLSVHSALPASDANQLAANDDAPDGAAPDACAGLDSGAVADPALVVEVAGGTTAWVRVASAGGSLPAASDFTLHVPEPGGATAAALAALALLARRARG